MSLKRGCSSVVEPQPSKLVVWVRFPSPAPLAPIAQLDDYPPHCSCSRSSTELRDFTNEILGCRLAVRATDFDSVIAGSNPAIPAISPFITSLYDPLAQLAEHLTFNQGVRSSNLRWITPYSDKARNDFFLPYRYIYMIDYFIIFCLSILKTNF